MKELVDEIIEEAIREGFESTRCRSGPEWPAPHSLSPRSWITPQPLQTASSSAATQSAASSLASSVPGVARLRAGRAGPTKLLLSGREELPQLPLEASPQVRTHARGAG